MSDSATQPPIEVDSIKALRDLNQGAPRVSLRDGKRHVAASGPGVGEISEMSSEDYRTEISQLSVFFMEEVWNHVVAFTAAQGDLLFRPNDAGDGFAPVDTLPGRFDPITELILYSESLLVNFCRFTESLNRAAVEADPTSTSSAIYARYCKLLSQMEPRGSQTPTTHFENGLVGLQVVFAEIEVIGRVYKEQFGHDPDRATYLAIIRSPEFERLTLAVAGTRARAANAVIEGLTEPREGPWFHSLYRAPRDQLATARLRLEPSHFVLRGDPPRLHIRPAALGRLRASVERIPDGDDPGWMVVAGRTAQLKCPAFAADVRGAATPTSMIKSFVHWILAMAERYYLPAE